MAEEKRLALVTGGTRGIGNAVARRFAEEGWSVLITGRTLEGVRGAVAACQKDGLAVEGKSADVRKEDDVRQVIEFAASRFGRIDLLVNNAGIGEFAPVDVMDPKAFREIIETNLMGPFYAIHFAAPHLKKSGGFVVNIGSLASINAFPGGAAYNASKFGLLGLSEAAMQDLRPEGVRVAIVMPGSVATGFGNPSAERDDSWMLSAADVARAVFDLAAYPVRAIPSRIELRPARPPAK